MKRKANGSEKYKLKKINTSVQKNKPLEEEDDDVTNISKYNNINSEEYFASGAKYQESLEDEDDDFDENEHQRRVKYNELFQAEKELIARRELLIRRRRMVAKLFPGMLPKEMTDLIADKLPKLKDYNVDSYLDHIAK